MRESTDRTQQPSWRRISWIAIVSLIYTTILRSATQRIPQVSPQRQGMPPHLTEREADRQMRATLQVVRVAAPSDFTARVMAQVAVQAPALQPVPVVATPSLHHRARVVGGTVGFSALVVLTSSFFAALTNPSLGLAVVGTLVSIAMILLAIIRVLVAAAGGISANGLLVTLLLSALLTVLLVSWTQLSRELRQFMAQA